jgi:penicillin-insensitive murein DD-endopeptidase
MIRAASGSATVLIGMLLSVAVRAGSLPADPWSNPTLMPSRGPAQVIGMPWDGCIAGATRLPWRGAGYEVLRPEEHRTFGDSETVHFVERLGREAHAAGLPMFYVGDMAQPRGGPMPAYHVSHQTGVDVDIYLTLQTDPHLSLAARETLEPPIMVKHDQSAIDPTRFGPGQVELLRLAASDPAVNRIFVNPAIKRALCEGYGGAGRGDRSWLHRVRPWYGHEAHFHVRLNCPADSPLCENQPPIPPGDDCEPAIFAWWSQELSKPKTAVPPPHVPAPLPAACTALMPNQ